MNMSIADGSWAVWSWNTRQFICFNKVFNALHLYLTYLFSSLLHNCLLLLNHLSAPSCRRDVRFITHDLVYSFPRVWSVQKHSWGLFWKNRKFTYRTRVEALKHPASLRRLQSHVLAESSVEAEGEREAASHPLPLLETSSRRLHVQQNLRPVVVGQGHAAHQPADRQTDRQTFRQRQTDWMRLIRLIPTPGSPVSVRCGCGTSSGSRLEVCSRSEPRCRSAPPLWRPLMNTTNISVKMQDHRRTTQHQHSSWRTLQGLTVDLSSPPCHVTFERGDHARTRLLQEALQLLPGSLQHRVVLHVAAQVSVVLFEQTVPGHTALQPVRTEHTNTTQHC